MSRPLCGCLSAVIVWFTIGCSRPVSTPPAAPAAPAPEATATPTPPAPPVAEVAPAPVAQPVPVPTPTAVAAPTPQATPGTTPVAEQQPAEPEAILRRIADFCKNAQSLQVDSEQVMTVTAQGIDQRMTTRRNVAAERPNRVAIRSTEGMASFDFISDGEQLFTYVPMLQQYSAEPAPDTFDSLLSNPLMTAGMLGGQSTFTVQLLADDPYAKMMEGVTESQYVATEMLADVRTHHLHFVQDQYDWDLWVPVDGDPLISQISTDMSKSMANLGAAAGNFKNMRMVSIESLSNWRFNAPVDAAAFTFTAPEGVKKVDSLFGGGGADEPSPLLGQPAPPIELELLDGGSLNLASHSGQSIVMLDFWATWCGPCVEELPILVKIADEYRDKGVAFFAVNQAEEPDDIRTFLEEQKLSFTVALDSESKTGDEYGVQGIPMLVLIDKQGTVQSVHMGFRPDLDQILRKELDDMLAGKSLAEETLAAAAATSTDEPPTSTEPEGLEEVWSVDGRFAGVAVDPSTGTIYAVATRGKCTVFSPEGQELTTFSAGERVNTLRAAKLTAGSGIQLLGFGSWGDSIVAMNSDGSELWQESGGQGIDDVWAADLDDDGQDEVIAGYNGGTGLHVFAADGVRRWEYTKIANVWHVAAGNVTGDAGVEVVSTSARGQVHLFDADGKHLRDVEVPLYANMVRVGKLTADSAYASIIVAGSGDGEQLVALKGSGTVLWTCDLPDSTQHCDSLDIAVGAPWAAAGLRGGLVVVVDTAGGNVIGRLSELGERPQVAWHSAPDGGAPLLLTASGRNLKAFRVVPKPE